jgi:hypothetical protein
MCLALGDLGAAQTGAVLRSVGLEHAARVQHDDAEGLEPVIRAVP